MMREFCTFKEERIRFSNCPSRSRKKHKELNKEPVKTAKGEGQVYACISCMSNQRD